MSDYRPDLQFGLSEEELVIARKALRLPADARLSDDNFKDWVLIRDTWLSSITTHPGGAEQRRGYMPEPVVETKKVISMSKYRR